MGATRRQLSLTLALCLACIAMRIQAQKPEPKCPVAIDHIELSYSHAGGESKPQLGVIFTNHARERVATATFSLSLLDSGGYPHPYPDDLIYREGLDPGKQKDFVWDLAPDAVDIHRTGEAVILQEIKFDDATGWKDDGSESCALTVDYHAR
jgi:hypothetical protein